MVPSSRKKVEFLCVCTSSFFSALSCRVKPSHKLQNGRKKGREWNGLIETDCFRDGEGSENGGEGKETEIKRRKGEEEWWG